MFPGSAFSAFGEHRGLARANLSRFPLVAVKGIAIAQVATYKNYTSLTAIFG